MSDHSQDIDPIASALQNALTRCLVWVCRGDGVFVPFKTALGGDE